MSRAATSPELTKFAGDGQWSELYCMVVNPVTVFAARVNQATIVLDKLAQLPFDTVTTGSYTDIVPGMTVWIGSSAGAYDRGMGFVRKAAGSAVLYLGETSNIAAVDNDYITVVREFSPWVKNPRVVDGNWLVNYDEAYVDQMSTTKPTIVCGGSRVLELTGATVATTYDLTGCFSVDTTAIASYATTCPGCTVTDGTTSAPIITASAAGQYLVTFTVTGVNGKSSSTYRWLFDRMERVRFVI
jgi:hypothetical protein